MRTRLQLLLDFHVLGMLTVQYLKLYYIIQLLET